MSSFDPIAMLPSMNEPKRNELIRISVLRHESMIAVIFLHKIGPRPCIHVNPLHALGLDQDEYQLDGTSVCFVPYICLN